jgi:hypothetical protein
MFHPYGIQWKSRMCFLPIFHLHRILQQMNTLAIASLYFLVAVRNGYSQWRWFVSNWKLKMRRKRRCVFVRNHKSVRHWLRRTYVCERSEAIQKARFLIDCFVAALLAMTMVCWRWFVAIVNASTKSSVIDSVELAFASVAKQSKRVKFTTWYSAYLLYLQSKRCKCTINESRRMCLYNDK